MMGAERDETVWVMLTERSFGVVSVDVSVWYKSGVYSAARMLVHNTGLKGGLTEIHNAVLANYIRSRFGNDPYDTFRQDLCSVIILPEPERDAAIALLMASQQ